MIIQPTRRTSATGPERFLVPPGAGNSESVSSGLAVTTAAFCASFNPESWDLPGAHVHRTILCFAGMSWSQMQRGTSFPSPRENEGSLGRANGRVKSLVSRKSRCLKLFSRAAKARRGGDRSS